MIAAGCEREESDLSLSCIFVAGDSGKCASN